MQGFLKIMGFFEWWVSGLQVLDPWQEGLTDGIDHDLDVRPQPSNDGSACWNILIKNRIIRHFPSRKSIHNLPYISVPQLYTWQSRMFPDAAPQPVAESGIHTLRMRTPKDVLILYTYFQSKVPLKTPLNLHKLSATCHAFTNHRYTIARFICT